jgi:hypothetical protein
MPYVCKSNWFGVPNHVLTWNDETNHLLTRNDEINHVLTWNDETFVMMRWDNQETTQDRLETGAPKNTYHIWFAVPNHMSTWNNETSEYETTCPHEMMRHPRSYARLKIGGTVRKKVLSHRLVPSHFNVLLCKSLRKIPIGSATHPSATPRPYPGATRLNSPVIKRPFIFYSQHIRGYERACLQFEIATCHLFCSHS